MWKVTCLLALEMSALGSPLRPARLPAGVALQVGSSTQPVVVLLEQFRDNDSRVREAAAKASGKLRDPRTAGPLVNMAVKDANVSVRMASTAALSELGPAAIDAMIGALKDPSIRDESLYDVGNILSKIGDPATGPIVGLLKSPDGRIRTRAVLILKAINNLSTTEALFGVLNDADHLIRYHAVDALSQRPPDTRYVNVAIRMLLGPASGAPADKLLAKQGIAAVAPVMAVIKDRAVDDLAAIRVGEALSSLGEPAIDGLEALLTNSQPLVRVRVARVLGKFAGARSQTMLQAALKDPDPSVRLAVVNLLPVRLSAEEFTDLLLKDTAGEVRSAAAYNLRETRTSRSIDALIAALGDEERVRRSAVFALSQGSTPEQRARLVAALSDRNPVVRKSVLEIFEDVKAVDTVPSVIAALKDSDVGVRKQAMSTLYKIPDERAVQPLIELLRDPNLGTVVDAGFALSRIGKPAVPPLLDLLNDRDYAIRSEAAMILGYIGDERAVQHLIKATGSSNRDFRWRASQALGEFESPQAHEFLANALKGGKLDVVAAAHKFFIRQGLPNSERTIVKALDRVGSAVMAWDLANCGNAILEKAASAWFDRKGSAFRPDTDGRVGQLKWGQQ